MKLSQLDTIEIDKVVRYSYIIYDINNNIFFSKYNIKLVHLVD